MLTIHPPGEAGASPGPEHLREALWIDLLEPTPAEIALVQSAIGVELPTRSEMQEIELSSRLYTEGTSIFMTATVIQKADATFPEVTPITFVLTAATLVTPEGKEALKESIKKRAETVFKKHKVIEVLFAEFVVQF